MVIILLGPPGAGKGTQAKLLEQEFGLKQLSTGDMFRARIKAGDALGLELKGILDAGNLVPDAMTIKMLLDRMAEPDCAKGVILDGFPRTVPQAEALDVALKDLGKNLDAVIELRVDEEALVERLSGRVMCADCGATYHATHSPTKVAGVCDACGGTNFVCREDDKPETVRARLKTYRDLTALILPYYQATNRLQHADGMADVDTVAAQIKALLG